MATRTKVFVDWDSTSGALSSLHSLCWQRGRNHEKMSSWLPKEHVNDMKDMKDMNDGLFSRPEFTKIHFVPFQDTLPAASDS